MAQHEVLSPLPGIFYRRPAPEKPPYKEDGDKVAGGDIIRRYQAYCACGSPVVDRGS
jgi:hypothetical protein